MANWFKNLPVNYLKKINAEGGVYFQHKLVEFGENVIVGHCTYVHGRCKSKGVGEIVIGKFCSIADGVIIHSGDNHNLNYVSTFPFEEVLGLQLNYPEATGGSVSIGNDVWIGEGVRIMSGSVIGSGAIIGAGSVVRGNIEPYAIYIGNPAKLLRFRFSESMILFLLELNWWDWSLNKIYNNSEFLSQNLNKDCNQCPESIMTHIKK